MFVGTKEFTSAIAKVELASGMDKDKAYFMIRTSKDSDEIDVCFSSGSVAIIEKIQASLEDKEKGVKVGMPLKKVSDAVASCQSSGNLIVPAIEIILPDAETKADNRFAIFKAEKKMRVQKQNSEEDSDGAEDESELKVVATFRRPILVKDPETSKQLALVNRQDYDGFFKREEDKSLWEIAEIKHMLSKSMPEAGHNVMVSSTKQCTITANSTYMVKMPIEAHPNRLSMTAASAKMLLDIVNKIPSDQEEIYIASHDNQHCFVYTPPDETGKSVFGMWFILAGVNRAHIATLQDYDDTKYSSYQLTIYREPILSAVKTALAAGVDKITMSFKKEEDGAVNMHLRSSKVGGGDDNSTVACEGCLDPAGTIETAKFSMALKTLSTILMNCENDFIAIDFGLNKENRNCLRISDIDIYKQMEIYSEAQSKLVEVGGAYPAMSDEQKLELRSGYLGLTHYAMLEEK
jgi:hypothetical protein